LYADGVRSILETDHKVIDVAHQSGFASQPSLHHAFKPEVENIMKVHIAQQHANRSTLRGSLLARMTAPSSKTPAFNQRRIKLIRRGSPTRCSTNRRTQS